MADNKNENFANDLSERAQAALEKIADRLPQLPKPVLAAIGAADLAGRQLSELISRLGERTGLNEAKMPERDEVVDDLRTAAADLPARVQRVAADLPEKVQAMVAEVPNKAKELADQIEQFATALPGKVQKLTDELPGKVSEVAENLQPETLKASADAYGQLISSVFETLAERGEKTWADIRNAGPVAGTVVDSPAAKPATTAPKPAAATPKAAPAEPKRTPRPARRPAGAAAPKPASTKTATTKSATTKSAAAKTDAKPATKPAAPKSASPKSTN